ncbi:hypothetical protein ACN27E_15005 [Mycobacterium sp. WMMD1722]|uniref:hypothetical protein n=1 Tax=Mycobacterium sp. WMMD1722 TaxID=3404117 RepID=UPI003BF61AA8
MAAAQGAHSPLRSEKSMSSYLLAGRSAAATAALGLGLALACAAAPSAAADPSSGGVSKSDASSPGPAATSRSTAVRESHGPVTPKSGSDPTSDAPATTSGVRAGRADESVSVDTATEVRVRDADGEARQPSSRRSWTSDASAAAETPADVRTRSAPTGAASPGATRVTAGVTAPTSVERDIANGRTAAADRQTLTAVAAPLAAAPRSAFGVPPSADVSTAIVRPLATRTVAPGRAVPLSDTVGSPMEWLMTAAARREVGDAADALSSLPIALMESSVVLSRVDLLVSTLVEPVRILLTDLRGLLQGTSVADPIAPGTCRDGECVPDDEIFLPWVRNEVTVLNLTGGPITLTNLDTKKPLTYGPQEGFVLANARQTQMAFYQGDSEWDKEWTYEGSMVWSTGSATVSVDVEAGGATASSSSTAIQTVIFDTPTPVTGTSLISKRQTLVLLPAAGSEITIDTSDPVGQAIVAAALCRVSGSCGQEVVDEEVRLSAPKLVGNTLFNGGSVVSTNRYKVAHEVVKTSGVEESLKIVAGGSLNFSLGPLAFQTEIGALIQEKYGHSWSDGFTTESQVDLDVPPGSYGQIYVQYPEYHDFVNMTLTNSGVTIKIPRVEYISMAPSGTLDENGVPLAVTYTTDDWVIGTGPHPYPDSGSVPTPPSAQTFTTSAPSDIAGSLAALAPREMTLGSVLAKYLKNQTRAFGLVPNILASGRAISSRTFQVVNLTPYAQTLTSISGEYEEDDSPYRGFVLQPFQSIDFEVDYNAFRDQETYVTWTNDQPTAYPTSAEFKVYNGGSAPEVFCKDGGCMGGGYQSDTDKSVMYIVYPYPTPAIMDVTNVPNLAAAAVNSACTSYYGATPGGCSVNVTGETYYNAPTTGPVQSQINRGSQTNSYYYTITTTKGETASWAAGGGLKLKEKAGVFVAQQIELEAAVLYTGSVQTKDTESSTVVQNLLPGYGGSIYIGDPYLRTYGDYIVNLPNLTLIVTGQWIEAHSGLGAQGPVANVVDYPLS